MTQEEWNQRVGAVATWLNINQEFFNVDAIAKACDVDWLRFREFVRNGGSIACSHFPRNWAEFAPVLDWAMEHGFGNLEPVEARFTVDAYTAVESPSYVDAMKLGAAREIGLHLLEHGFLTFVEMGDVTKPGEFRRILGFRLVGHAVKLPYETK